MSQNYCPLLLSCIISIEHLKNNYFCTKKLLPLNPFYLTSSLPPMPFSLFLQPQPGQNQPVLYQHAIEHNPWKLQGNMNLSPLLHQSQINQEKTLNLADCTAIGLNLYRGAAPLQKKHHYTTENDRSILQVLEDTDFSTQVVTDIETKITNLMCGASIQLH